MILAFLSTYAFQLKKLLLAASYAVAFYAGHYIASNAWEAEKAKHTEAVANAIPQIIRETQTITKVIHDSKDACAVTAIPSVVLNELR